MRQPGWEGSLGENGYMYMYAWVPFCSFGTITTLLINYTPYKIKRLKNFIILPKQHEILRNKCNKIRKNFTKNQNELLKEIKDLNKWRYLL